MDVRLPADWRQAESTDVGTLWIMRYAGHHARCAVITAPPDGWELRVLVDGHVVLSQRCARGQAAFAVADAWKAKMADVGWRWVVHTTW